MAKKEKSYEVGRGLAVSALRPWKGWGWLCKDSWGTVSAEWNPANPEILM